MSRVRTEQIGDVLLIEINNPPINAGSLTVRQGLTAAIQQLQAQPDLRAGVIIGGGTASAPAAQGRCCPRHPDDLQRRTHQGRQGAGVAAGG